MRKHPLYHALMFAFRVRAALASRRILFWVLAAFMAFFGRDGLRAQQKQPVTSVQPDVMVFFNLSAASSGAQAPVGSTGTSVVIDNHSAGAYGWTVAYTNHGASGLSLSFQSAPDNAAGTAPGTWSTVAVCGGTSCLGVNPNTAITSAITTTQVIAPWLRMNLTSITGTGGVVGVLYGWKVNINAGNGGGAGSNCPAGSVGQVQYFQAVGLCAGAPQLTYASASNNTNVGPGVSGLNPFFAGLFQPSKLFLTSVNPENAAAFSIGADGSGTSNATWSILSVLLGGGGSNVGMENDVYLNVDGSGMTGHSVFVGVNGAVPTAGTVIGEDTGVDFGSSSIAAVTTYGTRSAINVRGGSSVTAEALRAAVSKTGGSITNARGLRVLDVTAGTNNWAIQTGLGLSEFGDAVLLDAIAFASLGTPSNGVRRYCSDCTVTSSIDNTCAASGTGSNAYRLNGAWKCYQ